MPDIMMCSDAAPAFYAKWDVINLSDYLPEQRSMTPTHEQKGFTMDRPDTLRLLRIAHDEIVTLRRRMAEMEPKAHAYDTLAATVRLNVREGGGYAGVDIAWELKEAVNEIVAAREAEHTEASVGA